MKRFFCDGFGMRRKNNAYPQTKRFFTIDLPNIVVEVGGVNRTKFDDREMKLITLEHNKIEILLVQDKTINTAGCALALNAGYFDDPVEIPGLAHLLEHMIIVGGNQKYPTTGEFDSFVSRLSGSKNAYTTAQETNFHFSMPYNPDQFEEAMDRFSSSFVMPAFNADGIDREAKVVDNEYSKNIGVTIRQVSELLRSTSNPDYPYSKFSCGNYKTLSENPREKNIHLRDHIHNFFMRHYSANRMKVVVVAPCSIENLETLSRECFGRIENRNSVPEVFPGKPFELEQMPRRFEMKSTDNKRDIIMSFPMEDIPKFQTEAPHVYVIEALQSTTAGTLTELLKERGWIKSLSAFPMQASNDCTLFWIIISCTEVGITDYHDDILHSVFSYLALIRSNGLPDAVVANTARRFASGFAQRVDRDPFSFAKSIASNMLVVEGSQYYLSKDKLSYSFTKSNFDKMLDCLTPDRVQIFTVHKGAEAKATHIEERYKALYSMERIPDEIVNHWRHQVSESKMPLRLPTLPQQKAMPQFAVQPWVAPEPVDAASIDGLPARVKSLKPNSMPVFLYLPKKDQKDANKEAHKSVSNKPRNQPQGGNNNDGGADETRPEDPFTFKLFSMLPEFPIVKSPTLFESHHRESSLGLNPAIKEDNHYERALDWKQPSTFDHANVLSLSDHAAQPSNPNPLSSNDEASQEELQRLLDRVGSQVGVLAEMPLNKVWTPLPEAWRRPVLIKATNKTMLWFKQNRSFPTPEIKVTVFIHDERLFNVGHDSQTMVMLSFYTLFVRDALSKTKKQFEDDMNVSFEVFPTDTCIALTFTGFDEQLVKGIMLVLEKMQRPDILNNAHLKRFKTELIDQAQSSLASPLNMAAKNMEVLTDDPKWSHRDVVQIIGETKFRQIVDFVPTIFRNKNIQVLVMGNIIPSQAQTLCSVVEKAIQKNGFTSSFPSKNVIKLEPFSQSYYITPSSGDDDRNSAYHARFQVVDTSFKNRALLLLLGSLMHSPCREFIRTKEAVGYLISSNVDALGLTAWLEFRFQSNSFGPMCIDQKLENFLGEFGMTMLTTTEEEMDKAKQGIASHLMGGSESLGQELVKWASYIYNGSYSFEQIFRVTDALFQCTLQDLNDFYFTYFANDAPERRKIVSGILSDDHSAAEEAFPGDPKKGKVTMIDDPYRFRFDHELLSSI